MDAAISKLCGTPFPALKWNVSDATREYVQENGKRLMDQVFSSTAWAKLLDRRTSVDMGTTYAVGSPIVEVVTYAESGSTPAESENDQGTEAE